MVYIKNWTDFESAATELYARAPNKVRYTVKFSPKTGHLVLKLTDDVKCIKYKTFSSIILNRFESLNLRLLSSMTNAKARKPIQNAAMEVDTPERGGTPAPAPTSTATLAGGEGTESAGPAAQAQGQGAKAGGGGGKKKKKGKR